MAYKHKLLADHTLTGNLCTNAQLANFISQYLIDMDCEAAAERIGLDAGVGYALIRRREVQKAIRLAANRRPVQQQRAEQMSNRLWDTSTADPRELIAPIYVNCRYCWGQGGGYQRTNQEMARDKQRHYEKLQWINKDDFQPPFDLQGGDGFDPYGEPNPNCTECSGRGELRIDIKDSRQWSPQAALLYDGVEMTQYGPRVKLRNRDHADSALANHLGLTKTRLNIQMERAAQNPSKLSQQELDEYLQALGIGTDQNEMIDITPDKPDES